MKNKKVCIFVFIMMFCFSISGVKAADGLVCYYTSDNTFGVKMTSANTYQGGEADLKKMSPAACVIGVIKQSAGKYQSALRCKAKKSNNDVIEIKISDFYNNVFGVNAPNWKTVYGYKKDKGVTKCPDTISFETTMFPTVANGYSSWDAGAFAFSDKYGCESDPEKTTIDSNHCMERSDMYKVKSSEWKKMSEYEKELDNLLDGKEITWDQDHVNPSSRTQSPNTKQESTANQKKVNNIFNYYSKNIAKKKVSYNVDGNITCTELIGKDNVKTVHSYLLLICVAGVVIVIVLGASDFIKAIASSDDDALKVAGKRIKYRIISVIILLLLPALVNFILSFADGNLHFEVKNSNDPSKKKDISIKLGKASDCGL